MEIFDGHNDVLLRLRGHSRTFFERGEGGHIDLPRAREGGLAGGLCAMFVPSEEPDGKRSDGAGQQLPAAPPGGDAIPPTPTVDQARTVIGELMDILFQVEQDSSGAVRVTRTVDEIERSMADGAFAAVMHIEGAEAIDTDFRALEDYYAKGLRSLGPVWSRPNAYGNGVPFRINHPDTGPGLTDAGKDLVRACNRLGIMIDLSHLNERGFWDVAEISEAPLVASHSNAHALCQTSRNLTDRQLDAIAESDGMVGVNFAIYFLENDASRESTSLEAIVRHVDYLANRVGIDRVGLGSDFDGAGIPHDLGDAAGLPRLVDALRGAGFDEESLSKITHENWLRVLGETWKE